MNVLLIPIGSAGDVHPFLGLAHGLRGRGHSVTVITAGYFESLVRREGFDFVDLMPGENFRDILEHPDLWHPTRGFRFVIRESTLRLMRRTFDFIMERDRPGETVVVSSCMGLGARLAQEARGVPLVTVALQPSIFRSLHETPVLPGLPLPASTPRFVKRWLFAGIDRFVIDPLFEPDLSAFRAELGLKPVRGVMRDWWLSPRLILGLFPEWLAAPQPDWPAHVQLTGFPLYDERDAAGPPRELTDFLDEGEPPVLFTAGSAMTQGHDFFRQSAESCRLSGRRGLLLTRFPEQLPPHLPEGVRHFEYVPFSQVLPRSAAIVHHGGIGTTGQALAAGIPQVVMPLSHDQFDNAARLNRLGVGATVPRKQYRARTVNEALGLLLGSTHVAARCRDYADRLRVGDPVGSACDAIESVVQGRRAASPTR